MEYETANDYYQAITMIEAQKTLVLANATSVSSMPKESRKKYYRELKKMAYPSHMQKTMEFDEFWSKVNG